MELQVFKQGLARDSAFADSLRAASIPISSLIHFGTRILMDSSYGSRISGTIGNNVPGVQARKSRALKSGLLSARHPYKYG